MASQKSNALQIRELSLTTNVLTVIADNGFFRNLVRLQPGTTVSFSGVASNTFLNSVTAALTSVTRSSASARWTLVMPVTHADVLLTGDSGDIFVSNPVSDPGPRDLNDPSWIVRDRIWKESQAQVASDGGKGVSHP